MYNKSLLAQGHIVTLNLKLMQTLLSCKGIHIPAIVIHWEVFSEDSRKIKIEADKNNYTLAIPEDDHSKLIGCSHYDDQIEVPLILSGYWGHNSSPNICLWYKIRNSLCSANRSTVYNIISILRNYRRPIWRLGHWPHANTDATVQRLYVISPFSYFTHFPIIFRFHNSQHVYADCCFHSFHRLWVTSLFPIYILPYVHQFNFSELFSLAKSFSYLWLELWRLFVNYG